MCLFCGLASDPSPPSRERRHFLALAVGAIGLTGLLPRGVHAQTSFPQLVQHGSPLNLPMPPDGGPHVPEFMMPAGSLGGVFALARPEPQFSSFAIYYDYGMIGQAGGIGSPFFRFTRAHEYGHVRSMHMPANQAQYFAFELQADCYAASTLKKIGDVQAINSAANAYQLLLPAQDSPGTPGSTRRIQTLQQCN